MVGILLAVVGAALALRAAVLLAGRGRPRRGPTPAFILAGPYLRLRNPLLGGVVLGLVGVALATRSWSVATVALVAALGAHRWVTRVEEPRLAARFGVAYAEYLRRVRRWLPRRPRAGD